jgi:hypothetical protein
MSAEIFEWVSADIACWRKGLDGMAAETLMRVCGPDASRIDPYHGPQVRLDAVMRIQRDHADQERRDAGYRAWRDGWGRDLAFHVQRAKDEARKVAKRRMPKSFQFMGPGGAIGGEQLPDSPEITTRIREAMIEAAEHAELEFRRKNPELDQRIWERKIYKK